MGQNNRKLWRVLWVRAAGYSELALVLLNTRLDSDPTERSKARVKLEYVAIARERIVECRASLVLPLGIATHQTCPDPTIPFRLPPLSIWQKLLAAQFRTASLVRVFVCISNKVGDFLGSKCRWLSGRT